MLEIYGFGSFFLKASVEHRDIDFLILHPATSAGSVRAAIALKAILRSIIGLADVVMLSKEEEREFSFVSRSDAILLGSVSEDADKAAAEAWVCGLRDRLSIVNPAVYGVTSKPPGTTGRERGLWDMSGGSGGE